MVPAFTTMVSKMLNKDASDPFKRFAEFASQCEETNSQDAFEACLNEGSYGCESDSWGDHYGFSADDRAGLNLGA